MRTFYVRTPENIELEYKLADLGSRSAAMIIDFFIQLLATLILFILLLILVKIAPTFWVNHYGDLLGGMLILLFLIYIGYFIICEVLLNGMTYGKKVMKIRVIRMNGQPLTLKHSMIRNLFKVFIDQLGIGVIMIFFSKHCRRLGDLAASTIVITEAPTTPPYALTLIQSNFGEVDQHLTDEEREILRNWFRRKEQLMDDSTLRDQLKNHFQQRFDALGMTATFENFIDQL